jgi:hypothetical protein
MKDAAIYRSAQILIEEQGAGALSHAAGRAAGFAAEGDAQQAKRPGSGLPMPSGSCSDSSELKARLFIDYSSRRAPARS